MSPPPFNPAAGQTFEIEISVDVGQGTVLGSYHFELLYDPAIVVVVGVNGGNSPAFSSAPATDFTSFTTGVTPVAFAQGGMSSPTGYVSVSFVTLQAVGINGAVSPLTVNAITVNDAAIISMETTVASSSVQIQFTPGDDSDSDGLTDLAEAVAGTDINLPDTDGDGLLDGFEVLGGLDALDNGTLIPDNGPAGDPDNDGLTNLDEQSLGTHPNRSDTDQDGLTDGQEITFNTIPNNPDTDGDTLPDGFEIAYNLDPLDDGSTNPAYGQNGDPDADGLTNVQELLAGTLPDNPDSDSDGIFDGYEINNGLDPLDNGSFDTNNGASGDPDRDGYSNLEEFLSNSLANNKHVQPINVVIPLVPGVALLGYPLIAQTGINAYDLLQVLNTNSDLVESMETISGTDTFMRAFWSQGAPTGDNFLIAQGHGVIVKVINTENLNFSGITQCQPLNLVSGINIVSFNCVPGNYTAQNLLSELGNALDVRNIQRFNSELGRYETATYDGDFVSGRNFEIKPGSAYIINISADRNEFDPMNSSLLLPIN